MNNTVLPVRSQTYQNVFMDSTRWDGYQPRDGDIVVATSYKGGTTWVQAICGALVFQSPEPPAPLDEISPWVDATFEPIEDVMARLEAMTHRRYLKTHLPLTSLPYHSNVRYVFVCRDGRDVWLSLWNHFHNMKPERIQSLIENPSRKGYDLQPLAPDVSQGFDEWIEKAVFPWEQDGYPAWSHHYHAQSWWNFRHLDNILCVHFADLLEDLDGQMRRIAGYLGIGIDEARWPELVESVTFGEMKRNAAQRAPEGNKDFWSSPANFFHSGTNGRWREVLSPSQAARYDARLNELVEPSLKRWMVHEGGFVDPRTL